MSINIPAETPDESTNPISVEELTDKQFQALGELLGEDPLEMGWPPVQPIHVVYHPQDKISLWSGT